MQEQIALCHRPTVDSGWGKRCLYLDDKYDPFLPYNHRSILDNEVVIEFDEDDKNLNRRLAQQVADILDKDKIAYSMWYTGGKSTHLHFHIRSNSASSLSLLKRCIIRYYTKNLNYNPDLQLTGNHLIRAEYGVHEKTGQHKKLLKESVGYPKECELPQAIWDFYTGEMSIVKKRQMTVSLKDIDDNDLVKKILDTAYIKEKVGDGRGRLVGALAQLFRHKYTNKSELIDFLWDWYKYSGGKELSKGQVAYQVHYAYRKPMDNPIAYLIKLSSDLEIESTEVQENKEVNLQHGSGTIS